MSVTLITDGFGNSTQGVVLKESDLLSTEPGSNTEKRSSSGLGH